MSSTMHLLKNLEKLIDFIKSEFRYRPFHAWVISILAALVIFFLFKGSSGLMTGAVIAGVGFIAGRFAK